MMLTNKSNVLWSALAAGLLLSACSLKQMQKMAKEQELSVNPSPLELHGDSVKFDVSVVLPTKMLKKNKIYTVKTWYEYGDPQEELEQFLFQDTEFPNQKVEQPSLKKTFNFDYVEGMETGSLKIKGVASNLTKTKYEETEAMEIAKGLITTSRLYTTPFSAIYADHKYNNKEELTPYGVNFLFDQGSAQLRKSEVVGENGKLLTAFIASKNKTRTVTITGTHSPEGLESINSKLAEDRAKAIREFYYSKMKSFDYKNLADSIKFETKAVFQDWEAMKVELNSNSTLTQEQKDKVLAIVNGSETFENKAKEISNLTFYKTILNEVYPKLRTSQTQILSAKPKKTDAEINVLTTAIYQGKAKVDTLSFDELMYAATLTPLLEEKAKIYEAAIKREDNWTAYNNLGTVYLNIASKTTDAVLKSELVEKALKQYELAANKDDNAITNTNLSTTYIMLGNAAKASSVMDKAIKMQKNTETSAVLNENIGVMAIRKGDYNSAINSLSAATSSPSVNHNLGLAYLLKKDYKNAEMTLEKATSVDSDNNLAYYLRAITAAKLKNETALGVLLTQAVQKNPKLKEKALKDLEFVNYAASPVFTNALK